MTPEAIQELRSSYAQVAARPRQLASHFYDELFTAAPKLRPLFPSDLTSLQGHFEAALALVIRNLGDIPALRESLRNLGAQHVHWGARPEDYVSAREALVTLLPSALLAALLVLPIVRLCRVVIAPPTPYEPAGRVELV